VFFYEGHFLIFHFYEEELSFFEGLCTADDRRRRQLITSELKYFDKVRMRIYIYTLFLLYLMECAPLISEASRPALNGVSEEADRSPLPLPPPTKKIRIADLS